MIQSSQLVRVCVIDLGKGDITQREKQRQQYRSSARSTTDCVGHESGQCVRWREHSDRGAGGEQTAHGVPSISTEWSQHRLGTGSLGTRRGPGKGAAGLRHGHSSMVEACDGRDARGKTMQNDFPEWSASLSTWGLL